MNIRTAALLLSLATPLALVAQHDRSPRTHDSAPSYHDNSPRPTGQPTGNTSHR